MITKELTKDLKKIITGVNKAANVVKTTMGAQGKNVIIANNDTQGFLRYTKDGVSVARSIKLEDPLENIGAQMVISAAKKTVEEVGDGTTATSVLLQALIKELTEHLDEVKNNPEQSVRETLEMFDAEINRIVDEIVKQTKEVKDLDTLKDIATVSSNSDKLGDMFRKMYEEIGLDSNVTLQRSEYSPETYYEVLKGIEFRSGYLHSAFITDKDTSTVVFDNPYIHIDEEPITSLNDHYVQLLETSLNNRIPLVIIAPKFSDSFIRNVVMNRTRNSELEVVLITSPGYGEGVKKNYKDIRAFLDEGGHVEKIIVNTHEFFLFNEDTPYLQEHLNVLNTLAETSIEPYDQQDYYERYHRLQGSTAIIYAGGITEIAREEEFDRVEDALGSVRASLRGGFVLGGGLCLYNIESPLESLKRPLKQILINANENVEEILPEIGGEIGYDVKNRKLKNFKNIIDPAPVVVQSLINAYATAKLLTNTSYALYNEI